MSLSERSKKSRFHEHSWVACVGDFVVFKDFLAAKEKPIWTVLRLLDALLRGFGQVAFANNPISGLLIAVSLGATASGTLIFSVVTAFLGLLLSMLMRDTQDKISNGLTVYNPLLVGAVSFALIPEIYGAFDAFSILLVLLGTIFSVYLARSLGNSKSPCTVWPFILSELALLFVLTTQDIEAESTRVLEPIMKMDNATSDATTDDVSFIGENATYVYIDWGMGIVVSASRVYAVQSVAAGAVVYLALLLYSPSTAGFAFLGALFGSLAGLELGVEPDEVYNGLWGFNSFLTGASLGGNLFVLNGQTVAATIVAILYTSFIQYCLLILFKRIKLPILTLPFALVALLFIKLRNNSEKEIFVGPATVSFPEKQRYDYLASRRASAKRTDDSEESDGEIQSDKRHSSAIDV